MRRAAAGSRAVLVLLALVACDRAGDAPAGGAPADVAPDTTAAAPATGAAAGAWAENGGVRYRREQTVDLTRDGRGETVIATAAGPAHDSLEVAITIEGADGDTLWHESWPSLLYFKYDPLEGKADTTVQRIVRDHVEELLASDRFAMGGGLPAALRRGGDVDAVMREAIHYHLAELDYRLRADLTPADRTPPEGYARINVDQVAPERVTVVLEELRTTPSFMYYAGGEATYAIAWSERENGFVRIYSCC